MKIELAKHLAESLVYLMTPFCERIEIAGSIRRGCTEVKDLEIVAVPKWGTRKMPDGLFGECDEPYNLLYEWAMNLGDAKCPVQWIKPNTEEVIPWQIKPDGKYWRGIYPKSRLKVDLFLCTPENWGVIYLIRTGSAEFSQAVIAHAKASEKYTFAHGHLYLNSMEVATPEEWDVFRHLGLEYVAPCDRTGYRAVRVRRDVVKEAVASVGGWNGENDSPAEQLAARKDGV